MKRAMGENVYKVTECTAKRQKTVDESSSYGQPNGSSDCSSYNYLNLNSSTPLKWETEELDSALDCRDGTSTTQERPGPGGDFIANSSSNIKSKECSQCSEDQLPNGDGDSDIAEKLRSFNGTHHNTCSLLAAEAGDTSVSHTKSINELPHSLLISIFQNLSLPDILLRVSLVCKFWRNLCCDPDIWRDIDLRGRYQVNDAILLRLTSYSGNVHSLDVTDVRLITNEGIQSTLKQCPRLKSLSLVRCEQLTDYAFLAVGEFCSSLTTLKLDSCAALTNQALIKLGSGCRQLRKVWLNKCGSVTDTGLVALAQGCTQLRLLSLEQCKQLTDEGLESLTSVCTHLEVLYLLFMGGRLTGQGLQNLAKLRELRHLEISQMSSLTDPVFIHIVTHCHQLTQLNVSLCENITDTAIVAMTAQKCCITSIHLVACKITDAALISLAKKCPTLESLDVGWCSEVTGEGATQISQGCPRLRYLGLMRCDRVTREISQRLVQHFPHITYSTMWLDFDKLMAKARMQGFLIA